MPQELQVLQCYSCKTFQVDIVKKEAKWSCKMCGDKQSVKKVFHRGNGKECRLYVQELNESRIKFENETVSKPENDAFAVTKTESENNSWDKTKSKWFEFMENSEDVESTNIENYESLSRGAKRKLETGEGKAGRKIVSKCTQPISTAVNLAVNLEKDLDQRNRIFGRTRAINSNVLISTENNIREVGDRKEVRKFSNSDREAKESKWNEFIEGRIDFVSNIEKDKTLNNRLNNKKCKRDKFAEPEYEKNEDTSNQSNIFEYETYRDIDSFLEM